MNGQQLVLQEISPVLPTTRYVGSKQKIGNWIWESVRALHFNTVLDAFGGTGSVSFLMKCYGKEVAYNDLLKFNYCTGLALIENNNVTLSSEEVHFLLTEHQGLHYPTFVHDTFKEIYFTDEENQWIDRVVTNIGRLKSKYKKALAYHALSQACLVKRPFNLFHRRNLYLRFSDVERTFGNKVTWDRPFEAHFRKFVTEANNAVFANGRRNQAYNLDVFDIDGSFDLVYVDPPYISKNGVGVDYFAFYHFLEGLVNYSMWKEMIDFSTKNKRLRRCGDDIWTHKKNIYTGFDRLFEKFRESILVVSYRSDGIPSIEEIGALLRKYKRNVVELRCGTYQYVLSTRPSEEVLLIGT